MSADTFVDTNILIYAHDLDAGSKHATAAALVKSLWESETGMLSIHVMQEFLVNVTRKIATPLTAATARGLVETYSAWHVQIPTPETVLHASELQERYQISFWDGMIAAAACAGDATVILSEILNHGQLIEGIRIENPFVAQAE